MKNPRVNDIINLIKTCHTGSEKIVSGITSEDLEFAPTKDMMTFGEQLYHIAFVERQFLRKISDALRLGINIPEHQPSMDYGEAQNHLIETWQLSASLLSRLNDEHLDQPVSMDEPDRNLDVKYVLHALVEHQVHHRGELIVYFRMMGRRPPRRYSDDIPD